MNQPEGYVLVQIKQLAQWREWANNVAAWSKQADRSSEVARLKASISSAMISATLPPASAAGEREAFEAEFPIPEGMVYWDGDKYGVLPDYENSYRADRYCGQWLAWQTRAALATLPPASAAGEREDGCRHGTKHLVKDCLRCGAPVCCGKCCSEDAVAGEIAYQLTKRLVIDISTARAAVDAALATKPQAEQPATPPAQTVQDSGLQCIGYIERYGRRIYDKRDNAATVPVYIRAARTRGDEVGK